LHRRRGRRPTSVVRAGQRLCADCAVAPSFGEPTRRTGTTAAGAESPRRPYAAAPPASPLGWVASGAYSSAVEHLPYKEVVAGSIPAAPTSITAGQALHRPLSPRSVQHTCNYSSTRRSQAVNGFLALTCASVICRRPPTASPNGWGSHRRWQVCGPRKVQKALAAIVPRSGCLVSDGPDGGDVNAVTLPFGGSCAGPQARAG